MASLSFASVSKRFGDGTLALPKRSPSWDAPFTPCIEVGWRLAHAHWGRGYATEAALACLERAFTTMNRSRVISLILPENTRSAGVARRIGEQLVDRIELRGRPANVWAIEKSAWLARG